MSALKERFEAYKKDGFTVFEKVFAEPQMQSWREKHAELSAAANNHQHMRLLGVDEQLQPRCNSGFLRSDEERWEEWSTADREAIKEA